MPTINEITDGHAKAAATAARLSMEELHHYQTKHHVMMTTDIDAGVYRERAASQPVPAYEDDPTSAAKQQDSAERIISATLYNRFSRLSAKPLLETNEQIPL